MEPVCIKVACTGMPRTPSARSLLCLGNCSYFADSVTGFSRKDVSACPCPQLLMIRLKQLETRNPGTRRLGLSLSAAASKLVSMKSLGMSNSKLEMWQRMISAYTWWFMHPGVQQYQCCRS